MTDIVERLDVLGSYPEEREAKDEILRLRTERDGLRIDRDDWKNAADDLKVFCDRAQAEVERLRAQVQTLAADLSKAWRELDRARRALLEHKRRMAQRSSPRPGAKAMTDTTVGYDFLAGELVKRDAEIEQLTADLKQAESNGIEFELQRDKALAEIERLKAEIEAFRGNLAEQCGQTLVARANNERLRRLLEDALDAYEDVATDPNIGKPGHFVTNGRRALEQKP